MNWFLWSLLSAIFAAATAILAKIGVSGIDSNIATAIRTTVVVVFAWGVAFAATDVRHALRVGDRALLFLTLSGLATALSWLCYFKALQLGEASRVAPVDKLSVAFVIVLSIAFLGEQLTPAKAIGGALIVAGVAVISMY